MSVPNNNDDESAKEVLAQPVQFLKGVGPQRAKLLAQLNLHTAGDLLFHFPRRYEDHSDLRPIAQLEPDVLQTVRGMVLDVEGKSTGFGKSIVAVLIRQGEDHLRGIWFNQPHWREKFRLGQWVLLSGKPRLNGNRWEMAHPRVAYLEDETDQPATEMLPVYSLTQGIAQHQMRRLIAAAVEQYADVPPEVFSDDLLKRYKLLPINDALRHVHLPPDNDAMQTARRRFIFQELFILQLALAVRRWQQQMQVRSAPMPTTAQIDARILRLFPFELTAGQRRVIGEIAADLAQIRPMNRLLQGDVGSGKTVAALYAILLCVAHHHQAALMAPTEILAQQHTKTLGKVLQASRVRWALLAGSLKQNERQQVLADIRSGDIDVVIGTHAVLQQDVQFNDLGLVVIDEQHKFGVRQRAHLRSAGKHPHYLVMTATPIPRSVTMSLFGDLDVSTLREMPPGRKEVNTYLVQPEQGEQWWEFVRKQLRDGRQAYTISPLVEGSENFRAANAEETYESLANGELEAFRVGLVHGRMDAKMKQAAMDSFRAGKLQVLVATSVIEVGVDVANATVMTILSPDRFGLAQLHQLRGRICRGTAPGFCGLLLDDWSEEQAEELSGEETDLPLPQPSERLQAFAETSDGFELAETDFRLRGPGDIFGTRQHGMPPLLIADLLRDADVLDEARAEAHRLIAEDPGLSHSRHARLRRMVLSRYGRVLDLGDVG